MHTPGPWEALFEGRTVVISGGQDNDDLAEFFYDGEATVSTTREQAEANARLCIAAPEMFAALQKIAAGFINTDFVLSEPPNWHSAFNQLQEIARAAIAKAESP